jgi:hypothetical protein
MCSQLREQIHSDPHIPTASPVICVWTISRCELRDGNRHPQVVSRQSTIFSCRSGYAHQFLYSIYDGSINVMTYMDVSKSSLDHLHPDERGSPETLPLDEFKSRLSNNLYFAVSSNTLPPPFQRRSTLHHGGMYCTNT